MMKADEWRVATEIGEYIHRKHRPDGAPVGEEEDLLESGLVDSLSMLNLVMFIEKRFAIDFTKTGIRRDDFTTIRRITAMVISSTGGD